MGYEEYDGWSDDELEAALMERAVARKSAFSVRQLENGNWLAAMEQTTPVGVAIVQSGEGEDRHATMVALLWADDFADRFEREGGPSLGG